ncbi:MAG: NAD(+)/NADH kinase [Thermodesulfobacteriota bacterium]|nr:NAD(+)/NADH kinase [Thermodesulfobacteriota bacterium]
MIVGVIAKPDLEGFHKVIKNLEQTLKKYKAELLAEDILNEAVNLPANFVSRTELIKKSNLIIVFGGDGTLLHVAEEAAINKKPVIGINLGSLGFLTEAPYERFKVILDDFFEGKLVKDNRQLLQATLSKDNKIIRKTNFLNDVVINKGALAKIISLDLYIDKILVSNLRADGLILSSPTGSTAYSLSAGGPIVSPGLPLVIVTPICPHTLSNRPLVVSDNSAIKIKINSTNYPVFATFDGNESIEIDNISELTVLKSKHKLTLLRSPDTEYFHVLKDKLMWSNNNYGRK